MNSAMCARYGMKNLAGPIPACLQKRTKIHLILRNRNMADTTSPSMKPIRTTELINTQRKLTRTHVKKYRQWQLRISNARKRYLGPTRTATKTCNGIKGDGREHNQAN